MWAGGRTVYIVIEQEVEQKESKHSRSYPGETYQLIILSGRSRGQSMRTRDDTCT
jgi:hypothetical protein